MKWQNLKQNKCPKCNKTFGTAAFSQQLGFIICSCGFKISNKRFSEIVNSQVTSDLEKKWDAEQEGGEDNV